jgi:hypothetical protein
MQISTKRFEHGQVCVARSVFIALVKLIAEIASNMAGPDLLNPDNIFRQAAGKSLKNHSVMSLCAFCKLLCKTIIFIQDLSNRPARDLSFPPQPFLLFHFGIAGYGIGLLGKYL